VGWGGRLASTFCLLSVGPTTTTTTTASATAALFLSLSLNLAPHPSHHHHHHRMQHHQQHRQPLAHRSTRSTRSSISNNVYNPLLASSVLSPAALVAVARGRSLPTSAAPQRPLAAGPGGINPPLPPHSSLPKQRPYPPSNSLALRDCVPDAHPDDANDPYLVAAYACLRAHVSYLSHPPPHHHHHPPRTTLADA